MMITGGASPGGPVPKRRIVLGLLVSAVFLALLLRQVDRAELGDALAAIDARWLVLAFAVELAALWVRALRWRLVLDRTTRIGTGEAWSLVIIGYAANNVLPVRAGELVRAQLLHDRHGTSRLAALGTIVVERILDGLVLALLLAATIALAGGSALLRGVALAGVAAFVAATCGVALLALRPRLAGQLVALLRFAPARVRPAARGWLGAFLGGVATLRGGRAWSAVLATSLVGWLLEAAAYWLVGRGFGLPLEAAHYLAVCAAANLAIAAPSTAGGVGPFEFFAREVAVAFGATAAVSTAYALALHALLLIPVVVLGLALLWHRHLGMRALVRAAETPEESAA
jgi:uncharacterized protein (TIRG00374 family)